MECEKIRTLFSEYIDEKLNNDKKEEVDNHLLECKECSKEFSFYKQMIF
jgi:predicted anti-sigma-YlaC factor YlaD